MTGLSVYGGLMTLGESSKTDTIFIDKYVNRRRHSTVKAWSLHNIKIRMIPSWWHCGINSLEKVIPQLADFKALVMHVVFRQWVIAKKRYFHFHAHNLVHLDFQKSIHFPLRYFESSNLFLQTKEYIIHIGTDDDYDCFIRSILKM